MSIRLKRNFPLSERLFIFLTTVFLLGSLLAIAQHPDRKRIDSLLHILSSTQGNDKTDLLNSLSEEYWWFPQPKPDSIFYYSRLANSNSNKNNYLPGISRSLLNLGVSEMYSRNFQDAEKYLHQCISLADSIHDGKSLAWGYLYLGSVLYFKNEYAAASDAYENATAWFQKANQDEGLGRLCAYRTLLFAAMGEYGKGFEYCRRSMAIRKKMGDDVCVSFSYRIFGNLYRAANDNVTALAYYRQALQYARFHRLGWWNEDEQFAAVYRSMKNYDSSFYYLLKALRNAPGDPNLWLSLSETFLAVQQYDFTLKILDTLVVRLRRENDRIHLMAALMDVSRAYVGKNELSPALKNGTEGLKMAMTAKARQLMVDGYQLMSKIYFLSGKTDSAFSYLSRYSQLKDSVLTDKLLSRLSAFENEATIEKKQSQLEILDRDNKISKAELKQKSLLNIILAVGLFMVVFLGVIIFRNTMLKKNNDQLENKKQLAELQQKTTELRMQALRAQMNPHFIFNSLNSINRYIMQSDKEQASAYLSKFSKLIRIILHNSQAELIPLSVELESLGLYLELEEMRFNHRFEYQIDVDKKIELDFVKVPPLMLQPFAENAIWHGLMHKKEKGNLDIHIYAEDEHLLCVLTDDGVGRKQAALFSGGSNTRHQSMGLKVTAERIELARQPGSSNTKLYIHDLVNADGTAAGTEVVIKMPLNYA